LAVLPVIFVNKGVLSKFLPILRDVDTFDVFKSFDLLIDLLKSTLAFNPPFLHQSINNMMKLVIRKQF